MKKKLIKNLKAHNNLQSTIIDSDQDIMQHDYDSKSCEKELYILEGKKEKIKKNCSFKNCNGKGNLNKKNRTHRRF